MYVTIKNFYLLNIITYCVQQSYFDQLNNYQFVNKKFSKNKLTFLLLRFILTIQYYVHFTYLHNVFI